MYTSHELLFIVAKYQRIFAFLVFTLLSIPLAEAQNDIALSQTSSVSTAAIGDQVNFTITVTNEGSNTLTNVVISDVIPSNTTFVSYSGPGTYSSALGEITINNVFLGTPQMHTLAVEITGEGIIYNLAEVMSMDQTDDDSTPGNGNYNEDDISSACISVPVIICPVAGETIEASVPVSGLTNIQWYRDTGSGPVAFGTGSPIDITAEGEYTFTADNAVGCEAGNCCPLIIEESCFDLALTKTSTTSPIVPGTDVTYTMTIYNQGDQDAYNIDVTDYLPSGFNFNATNATNMANNWTLVGINPTSTITGPLLAGNNTTLDLVLTVDPAFQGTTITNVAEISAADNDTDATNGFPSDADSTADTTDNNDAGGSPNSAADNAQNGDGTGAVGGTNAATDEDDSDPEQIVVTQTYDLALTKTITSTGPYEPGDIVTYDITVSNQGTLDANNIVVTDRLPTGLNFITGTGFNNIAPHTSTIASLPSGGAPVVLTVTVQIDGSFQGTSLTNVAEITTDDGMDVDSTPDNDVSSEDDQGEALLTINQFYDLALTKTLLTSGPYEQGDFVSYEITVFNQGTLNASNVVVTDMLPTGLNFVTGTGFSATAPHTSTIANLPAGGSPVVLNLQAQIDANFQGASLTNVAEITTDDGDDIDSTPDNDIATEDDQDDIPITVDQEYDLALTKAITSAGPYAPGDMVTYAITVSNEGSLNATNVVVTDMLPAGLNFVSGTGFSATAPHTSTIASLPSGGAPVVLTLTAMIDASFQGTSLTNVAEITTDDGDDIDSTPDNDVLSEDDQEEVPVTVDQEYDLALTKAITSAGPYVPGDMVTYAITVSNEGSLDATNVVVTDMLPTGLNFVSGTGFSATAPHTSTIASLPSGGAPVVLTLTAMIDASFQGTSLTNVAEITTDDGDDADSTPDNDVASEDDQDEAPVTVGQAYDLALTKAITSAGPYTPGDMVTYAITVSNEGSLNATNVVVTDMLPTGLNFVSGTGFSATAPHTSTIASLPSGGAPVVLTLTAMIDASFQGTSLTNVAEITTDDGDDIDSTPDNDVLSEDDQEEVPVTVDQEYDLALTKAITSAGPYVPGDMVTYAITVSNEGSLNATNVVVTDMLPAGLNFVSGTGFSATAPHTSTIASLPSGGAPVVLTLTAMIDASFQGTSLTNVAEITSDDGDDIDSTPDNDVLSEDDQEEVPVTVDQEYDLALTKAITSAGPYVPGDLVTYAITVSNEGSLDATNVVVKDMLPTGLNFVSGTGFSATAPHTSTIASLPSGGAPVVLTLTAMIDASFQGTSLTNVAEITTDDGDDADSTPDNDVASEDDQDEVPVTVGQAYDLALTKAITSAGPYVPGDMVTYAITVSNEGSLDATNVVVTDMLPTGLNFVSGTGFSATAPHTSTIASLPSGGAPVVLTLTAMIDASFQGTSLTNVAEITTDDGDDIDSTPDNDVLSEDDQEEVPVTVDQEYDLALTKAITSAGPYVPGDMVTYAITVSNEGSLNATNVVVTDMLPTGLNFVSGTGFSATAPHTSTIASLPSGGAPVVLTLTAMIDASFQGTSLTNVAEITTDDGDDIDSTPDNDVLSEDDQEEVPVTVDQEYDLALTKAITSAGPYVPGDMVTYAITVSNEGSLDATNVVVTDMLPTGLNFVSGTGFSATAPHTSTIASLPSGGAPVVLTLTAMIDASFQGTSLTNVAEITTDDGDDIDSTPDNDVLSEDDQEEVPVTVDQEYDLALTKAITSAGPYVPGDMVTYAITVSNEGSLDATNVVVTDMLPTGLNFVSGTGFSATAPHTSTIASLPSGGAPVVLTLTAMIDASFQGTSLTNVAEITTDDGDDADSTPDNDVASEDDQDEVPVTVGQAYDLALTKAITSAGPYVPGDMVTYAITVSNEGSLDATNVVVTDMLPTGLNFVSGTGFSATAPHTSTIASLPSGGAPVVLTLTAMIDASFQGTSLTNVAEITTDDGDDIDSTPDNDVLSEDDQEEVPVTVDQEYDLALTKAITSAGPYVPGDMVTYAITVSNEGSLDATNVVVTDMLPTGLNFVSGTGFSATAPHTSTIASLPSGGAPVVLTLTAMIDASFQGTSLTNVAEITTDDGDDADSTPDNDVASEDDQDEVPVTVGQAYDLALTKAITSAGPYVPGDMVTYAITVSNEGSLDATNVVVTDMLPTGLNFVSGTGFSATAPHISTIASLPSGGAPVVLTLTAMIDASFQETSLTNVAEITTDDGDDADSTPDNDVASEDDQDEVPVTVGQEYDLALTKVLTSGGVFSPGDIITFQITVENEGSVDATNVAVTDRLPSGLTFISGTGFSLTAPYTSTIASLPAGGAPVVLTIAAQIDAGFTGTSLTNVAEITTDDGDDADSTPDNDVASEDDQDEAEVMIAQDYDLALTKVITSAGPYSSGDMVTYSITVSNEGTIDATNVVVTDVLPMGLNFVSGTGFSATAPHTSTIASLPAGGAPVVLTLTAQIDGDFQGESLTNVAEITTDDGMDIDSTPDNDDSTEDDQGEAPVTINQSYDLALTKATITTGPYEPGDFVTYEITVSNQGTIGANSIVVTDVLPTGLNFVSGTGFSATAPHTSTIASLPAGGTPVVLTVTAQIDASFQGTSLTNVAEITTDDGDDIDSTPDNNDSAEDDQGEAIINIGQTFDLALTKVAAAGPFAPGDDVVFDLTVYNQGSTDAYNVELTDYMPSDFIFDPTNALNTAGGWAMVSGNPTTTIAGPITAGTNTTIQLVLQIDPSFESTLMVNKAEISAADDDTDATNTPPTDVDSTPDVIITNDAGGFADTPSDNAINGDGTGVPNDTDPTTDEDDADPALVTVTQNYDLALNKVADTAGPFNAGDDVTFTITVTNEGSITANNISVVDLLPTGMSFVSSSDFTATAPHTAMISTLSPSSSVDLSIVLQIDAGFTGTSLVNESEIVVDDGSDTDSTVGDGMGDDYDTAEIVINQSYDLSLEKTVVTAGPYAPGDIVEYQITVTNQGSQPAINIEVVDLIPSGMSFFSSSSFDPVAPHTAIISSINPMQSETVLISLQIDPSFMGTSLDNEAEVIVDNGDDSDSTPNDGMGDDFDNESITVGQTYDLELVKNVITAGPYSPGDVITYEIELINNGSIDAANVEVVDLVPAGMSFVSSPDFSGTAPHTAVVGTLNASSIVTLSITLQIDANYQGTALVNEAEVTVDDGMDIDSNPADGAGDDYDSAPITVDQVFDLALTKEVVGTDFDPGDDVTFNITVFNQGTVDAYNISVTDYLPANMNFDATNTVNAASGWGMVSGNPTVTIPGPLAPNTSTVVQLVLEIDGAFTGTSIINNAEISAADDDLDGINGAPTDIDSSADNISTNDAGGLANSMADNALNGDGTGAVGDGVDTTDEDDADPAMVIIGQVFDLALIKTVSFAGPFNANDIVVYTIEVINQGSVDAYNVEVVDYIPSNLIFDATNVTNSANGWIVSGANATTSIGGPIAANGGSQSIDIALQIDPTFTSGMIDNFAEIMSGDNDTDGTNTAPTDDDSTYDSVNGNDAGGAPNTAADNSINGDGTGAPGDGVDTTDEDDHDVAQIEVQPIFDLALTKVVSAAQGSFIPGELVTFTMEVFNQGDEPANNIVISDYIPTGLTLEDSNWTMAGGVASTTIVLNTDLMPGSSTTMDVTFRLDNSLANGTTIENYAEISSATNSMGAVVGDVDSTMDDDPTNDVFVTNDDVSSAAGDEDDHDVEVITVTVFDLALRKTRSDNEYVTPGGDIAFDITVFNQGTIAASNIEIFDYVPTGFSLSPNDMNGWFLSGVNAYNTIAGPILAGDSASVEIVLRASAGLASGAYFNRAEIIGSTDASGADMTDFDIDSSADMDDTNDNEINDTLSDDGTFDEDDADVEPFQIDIFDIALQKLITGSSEVTVGGDITFSIVVLNQGTIDATNIEVIDFIPSGFTLSASNTVSWTMSGANATTTIASLNAGQQTSLDIVLTANVAMPGSYENIAEISSAQDDSGVFVTDVDSTPDSDATNDNFINDEVNDDGALDEDDNDREGFTVNAAEVVDIALIKRIASTQTTPVTIGDDVIFEIEIFNQGSVDLSNIQIVDYLPMGMTLSTADTNGWTVSGATTLANTFVGPLTAGTSAIVELVVSTDASIDANGASNSAEVASFADLSGTDISDQDIDSDADSDPTNDGTAEDDDISNTNGDEDDADFALVTFETVIDCDLMISETITDFTCCEAGSIELSITGGSGVYTATWSDATLSGLSVSGLTAGNYDVTVVDDATACELMESYTIVDNCNCTDLIAVDTMYIASSDPSEICLPFTYQESQNIYDVILAGTGEVQPIDGCDIDSVVFYTYALLVGQGNTGPYRLDTWTCANGQVYGNVVIQDMNELADSMNVWDPAGNWVNSQSTFTISGGADDTTYDDMEITHLGTNITAFINFNITGIAQGQVYDVPDTPGTYDFTITNNNECCTEPLVVVVQDPDCDNVVAGMDESICLGESVELSATLNQVGVTYSWSPVDGLSCTDCANPLASPSTTVNYQVTASYGACSSTDAVTVTVVPVISIDETIIDASCCDLGSISLNVTGGSGSYIATWSDSSLSGLSVSGLTAGSYDVTITDSASNCSQLESYTILDDCSCEDLVAADTINILNTDPSEICLPFTYQESQNIFEVILAGTGEVQPVDGCDIDSVVFYTYALLVGQGNTGPYRLDTWTCANGQVYGGVIIQDMDELADSMNVWDPAGNWINTQSTFTISGGADNTVYDDMEITHLGTNITAFINFNITGIAQGQLYDVPDAPGVYNYTITNSNDCCTEPLVVIVEAPEPITPDYTSYFTEVNTPVFACVNTNELATTPISLEFCDEPENGQVIFDSDNTCMTYLPNPSYVGLDSFCVVVCDESGICDTTYTDITISEEPHSLLDTITYTTPQNTSTGFQCMPWQKFFSTGFDTLIVCGEPMNGTLISDGDNECIEYIPDNNFCGQDSMCITTCSDLGVCGTITIYINVACDTPMPEPDTIYVSVLVNTILEDACVPLDELNGSFDTLYLCGDASNGAVATNDTDHCVDYTPDLNYTGLDEFCVVVCDSMMICDTTYFIIDISGDPCDTTTVEFVSLEAEDCDSPAVLCLPFAIAEVLEYDVTVGGDQYSTNFVGCDFDTTFSYNYFTVPGQGMNGPFVLDQWIVNGMSFNGSFVDISDLVNLMNSFDTSSTWILDEANFRIRGGNPDTDYGDMFISQPSTGGSATLQFNENLVANRAGMLLPVGMHDVRLAHTSGCPIYQYNVNVTCTPIVIDTIPYTFEVGDTLTVCPDELGITDQVTGVFNNCPTSSGNEASVEIDLATGCISMIGLVEGDNEFACLEICTADSCAQIVFLLNVMPDCIDVFASNAYVITANDCNAEEDFCMNIPFGNIDDYVIEVDDIVYAGNTAACTIGTAISLIPGTYNIRVTDSVLNCIDSTMLTVACITPDTIYDTVSPMEVDSVCIDLDELVGAPISIDNFCPNSSGEYVLYEINAATNCVTYTGVEIGIDTACIVVCDDQSICDTTYIIVEVSDQVGEPPVAIMDVDTTLLNVGATINISLNDSIPGGIDTLYVQNNPGNGFVAISDDMTSLIYTPDIDYCDSEIPDEFSYVVCNEFGCDTAVVQVLVLCEEVIFYTGFSPNNDGVNDAWIIEGIENLPDHELAIYNRWGNQVLFSKDYKNDWYGTWENIPLPDGTYFYVFDDGNGNVYSGYIQINR